MRGPAHGWNEATVGSVLTIAGLLCQTLAGSLIDRARNKPGVVMAAVRLVTPSSVAMPRC